MKLKNYIIQTIRKKNGNIFFKGFMTLELTTNVQTDNPELFYVASLAVFTLETALDTDYPSLV